MIPREKEEFVSETIRPVTGTQDTGRMSAGGPALPEEFVWRGRNFHVGKVLKEWRETGPCRNGSPERYVRKHWFEVLTVSGEKMKIYFERQPRRGASALERWWLFTFEGGGNK